MARFRYTISYLFENNNIIILEIKRDIPAETDRSKLYYWLVYDRKNDSLSPLEYLSSKKEGNKDYRLFSDNIILSFDSKQAEYSDTKKVYKLNVIDKSQPLSPALQETIDDYLVMLSF